MCRNSAMKNFSCRIDTVLDLKLSMYAIHLGKTKGETGAIAMTQGIPAWIMALPPSEARALADASTQEAETVTMSKVG